MIGIGVALSILGGSEESYKALASAMGKTIKALSLGADDALHFEFEDGSKIRLFDDGQSCCESRYMRTDDDLSFFVGAQLTGVKTKEAPNAPAEYGKHEIQFLEVQTSKGVFTMATHNEHNGYYGGFYVRAAEEKSSG